MEKEAPASLADLIALFDEERKKLKFQDEIEFPLTVSGVIHVVMVETSHAEVGSWCSVRPVGDEKTYLGIYLGELPWNCVHHFNSETKELVISLRGNPAIYIPDLKRVVRGYESWWGVIESPDQLREITTLDIENLWYVKAMKELMEGMNE